MTTNQYYALKGMLASYYVVVLQASNPAYSTKIIIDE